VSGAAHPYWPDTNGDGEDGAPPPGRPGTTGEGGDGSPRPGRTGTNGEGRGEAPRPGPPNSNSRDGGEAWSSARPGSRERGDRRREPLWRDPSPRPGRPDPRRAPRPLWRDPSHPARRVPGGERRRPPPTLDRPVIHDGSQWREDSGVFELNLEPAGSSTRQLSTLARGGALNLFGLLVSGPMQIALTIVVARGVGVGGTGAFFEAVALFTILSNVGELGADTGLVKMLPHYRALDRNRDLPAVVRTALWPPILFCLGLAAVVWLSTPQLAAVMAHGQRAAEVELYLRTFTPFIPLGAITTVVLAGTRGMGTMVPFVWIQNIVLPTLRPVLVEATIALGLGTVAVALGWAAPLAVAFIAGFALLWRMILRARAKDPVSNRPTQRRAIASEFWRFAGPRALAAVFGITITWLDVLLVGAFMHSTRQAGIYAAASRLSVLGASALSAVGMAIAPQVSQLATLGRMRDAESVFQTGTWWLMALTWPGYITLAIFAPFLLRVYGHGFVAGQTALAILCAAQLFNLGTGNVTIVLLMAGKSSWNLINSAAALAANIGINIYLIPRLGITGAAIAWAAAIVINNLAAVLEVNYLMKIRPFGAGYWVVAISSTICFGLTGLIIRKIVGANAAGFLLFAVFSTLPYVVVLWRARGMLRFSAFRGAISRRRRAQAGY
jgi:O-antigen/teichoic acid export membrane protein